jgi:hypothetical protein
LAAGAGDGGGPLPQAEDVRGDLIDLVVQQMRVGHRHRDALVVPVGGGDEAAQARRGRLGIVSDLLEALETHEDHGRLGLVGRDDMAARAQAERERLAGARLCLVQRRRHRYASKQRRRTSD